jgi:hypothetical protein
MAGLVPAIHVFTLPPCKGGSDGLEDVFSLLLSVLTSSRFSPPA